MDKYNDQKKKYIVNREVLKLRRSKEEQE